MTKSRDIGLRNGVRAKGCDLPTGEFVGKMIQQGKGNITQMRWKLTIMDC
jgi:hypothetical protein